VEKPKDRNEFEWRTDLESRWLPKNAQGGARPPPKNRKSKIKIKISMSLV
jgi:hypothetical protein